MDPHFSCCAMWQVPLFARLTKFDGSTFQEMMNGDRWGGSRWLAEVKGRRGRTGGFAVESAGMGNWVLEVDLVQCFREELHFSDP